jgi:hypothetical protein
MLIDNNNEFVYVPLPRHLLPAFCQWLLKEMEKSVEDGEKKASLKETQKYSLNIIDLSIAAAHNIGADQRSVSLAELHKAYLDANPGIEKGTTLDGFGATINYHTINMRSRFPDRTNKQKPASWLSRPVFKRVGYGQYMLLSSDERDLFRRRVEEEDPRVYQDEYEIESLL